jgi:hypothetical protein
MIFNAVNYFEKDHLNYQNYFLYKDYTTAIIKVFPASSFEYP